MSVASSFGLPEIVKFLIDVKADPSVGYPHSPLEEAAKKGNLDVVILLLKTNQIPPEQVSLALEIAERFQHSELVELVSHFQETGKIGDDGCLVS